MKQRIWELDAFRGLCILFMVVIHGIYDLVELYAMVDWRYPALFSFVQDWGGVLFLVLSGICVTLGRNHVKRGVQVFACGLIVTAVTAGMYLLDFADRGIIIYFGVLHCLGVCMLLWHPLRKSPTWALGILGAVLAGLGLWLRTKFVSFPWLIPLGLCSYSFVSSDYFPILPYFGFFLLGAVVGRTVYRDRQTRFPGVSPQAAPVRFLTAVGRNSLLIYLLHQPVLAFLLPLIGRLF